MHNILLKWNELNEKTLNYSMFHRSYMYISH
jgi:hypothetical protein